MTPKQMREFREDLSKYQSETKDTIKRDIHELKRKHSYKRGVEQRFENLRRKNHTEILEIKSPFSQTKNTVEDHSSRLEQVEDRISKLIDKI
jgi:chromosome segregation ATPase